jgi:hypothetical protein
VSEYRVVIPPESGKIVRFEQRGLLGLARINTALKAFEPKIVFAWHLSLMLRFVDLAGNRMPSREERLITEPFCDRLEAGILCGQSRPNAIFLARVTVDATQELIYRVFDPEPVDVFLKSIIAEKARPREFDYRIDHDPEWKLAQWHFDAGERKG